MKVAFEPKLGYFLGQIYTTEVPKEDVLENLQLPKHIQKFRKLGDNKLFIIRAVNQYNTYKVDDIVHVELDPKDLTPMVLNTNTGSQEFYFMPEDFIMGKKVSIQDIEETKENIPTYSRWIEAYYENMTEKFIYNNKIYKLNWDHIEEVLEEFGRSSSLLDIGDEEDYIIEQ